MVADRCRVDRPSSSSLAIEPAGSAGSWARITSTMPRTRGSVAWSPYFSTSAWHASAGAIRPCIVLRTTTVAAATAMSTWSTVGAQPRSTSSTAEASVMIRAFSPVIVQ